MLQNKMAMRKVKGWICCLGQDKEDEPCVAYARQDERYKLNAWTLNPLPLGQPCSAKYNFTSRLEELRREKAPEILMRRSASHWTLLLHWMAFVRLELKRKNRIMHAFRSPSSLRGMGPAPSPCLTHPDHFVFPWSKVATLIMTLRAFTPILFKALPDAVLV